MRISKEEKVLQAITIQYLKKYGYTQKEIGQILCMKESAVSYLSKDLVYSKLIHNSIAEYLNDHCDKFCGIYLRSVGDGQFNTEAFIQSVRGKNNV